jgi:large subunit ribosomal protein L17
MAGKKLGRSPSHRAALRKNFICSVIHHERVVTTLALAKGMRSSVEKIITLGKKKDLARIRRAVALIKDRTAVRKLFDELGPRYASRPGGYTRILRLSGYRIGDGGSKAIFELVGNTVLEKQIQKQTDAAAAAQRNR